MKIFCMQMSLLLASSQMGNEIKVLLQLTEYLNLLLSKMHEQNSLFELEKLSDVSVFN